jgi:hypothetical protein
MCHSLNLDTDAAVAGLVSIWRLQHDLLLSGLVHCTIVTASSTVLFASLDFYTPFGVPCIGLSDGHSMH